MSSHRGHLRRLFWIEMSDPGWPTWLIQMRSFKIRTLFSRDNSSVNDIDNATCCRRIFNGGGTGRDDAWHVVQYFPVWTTGANVFDCPGFCPVGQGLSFDSKYSTCNNGGCKFSIFGHLPLLTSVVLFISSFSNKITKKHVFVYNSHFPWTVQTRCIDSVTLCHKTVHTIHLCEKFVFSHRIPLVVL